MSDSKMLTQPQSKLSAHRIVRDPLAWSILLVTLAFVFVWLFPFQPVGHGLKGYAPLHTILETFAIVIAGSIFIIGWDARLAPSTEALSLLGVGFLGVALLDVAHVLSFKGMPDWISHSGGGKAIYFWFLARYLAAITLLGLVALSNSDRLQHRISEKLNFLLVSITMLGVAVVCWLVLAHEQQLPVFLIPGQGLTPLKIIMEWILIGIMAVILYMVIRKTDQPNLLYDRRSMIAALWLMMLSELSFTLYSDASDIFNLLGHIYKVLAYGFLYYSIVRSSIKLPFQLLAQSQEVLQQLTDNIHQMFWMTSVDKKQMLYMSPAFENVWKRKVSDLMANPSIWFDAVHPDDNERVQQYLKNQRKGKNEIQYRIILADGSIRHIHTRSFPILDVNGEATRIAGVAEDITRQIEDQDALRNNERLLQETQAISHLGSWEYNLKTDKIFWSDEVYRIFGIQPEDFSADYDAFLAMIHPEDRQMMDNVYKKSVAENREGYELEHRIIRPKSKEVRYVYEKCQHIRDENGNIIRSIGMSQDITERKLAEMQQDNLQKQLVQSQKMEAIGHLTGGIAHDFNNMLGAILGYAELLNMRCEPCDATQKRFVDEIIIAGNRAKELIAQMLVFSRLRPDTDAEVEIYITPVIKEVIQLLRLSIPTTIDLNYQVMVDDLKIVINPVQLHQIIMNLAINARDACGEYGQIDIKIDQQHQQGNCDSCHTDYNDNYIVISVSDTGSGINNELREKIFDPFFTTKEVGKGTGMGLSVVHGMVHSHGGHIRVIDREDRQGTVFQILLPPGNTTIESTTTVDPQLEDKIAIDLSNLRILVVDDEPAVAEFITELLKMNNATVDCFYDPLQAMAAFNENPQLYDLLISDETMPNISGLDMAQRLRQQRANLPIILTTGFSERVTEETIANIGINKLLHKPIAANDLLQSVVTLCISRP